MMTGQADTCLFLVSEHIRKYSYNTVSAMSQDRDIAVSRL